MDRPTPPGRRRTARAPGTPWRVEQTAAADPIDLEAWAARYVEAIIRHRPTLYREAA